MLQCLQEEHCAPSSLEIATRREQEDCDGFQWLAAEGPCPQVLNKVVWYSWLTWHLLALNDARPLGVALCMQVRWRAGSGALHRMCRQPGSILAACALLRQMDLSPNPLSSLGSPP